MVCQVRHIHPLSPISPFPSFVLHTAYLCWPHVLSLSLFWQLCSGLIALSSVFFSPFCYSFSVSFIHYDWLRYITWSTVYVSCTMYLCLQQLELGPSRSAFLWVSPFSGPLLWLLPCWVLAAWHCSGHSNPIGIPGWFRQLKPESFSWLWIYLFALPDKQDRW